MAKIPGYTVTETIFESNDITLQKGLRNQDNHPVLLKSTVSKRPPVTIVRQLEHEYSLRDSLNSTWAIQPIEILKHPDGTTLVLEGFSGSPLNMALSFPVDPAQFLKVAASISSAMAEMQSANIVHKDINPRNILIDPATYEVKLTGFCAASLVSEYQTVQESDVIEGTLPYISPEQTGRMNRPLDSRTDMYSLGIVFYQMLTGDLPFRAKDPLEWMYAHIAMTPTPLSAIRPKVPEEVSDIVLKLIAKVPDDRYQSALGLRADLGKCLKELQATGSVEPFPLGKRDIPERLQIPQKLYGRQNEITRLINAFEQVVRDGNSALMLVSGYSGIGKSTLVRELYGPVVSERGFFVSGKFDQYKRDIPYSTIVQAFQELVQQILTRSKEETEAWKQKLQEALGINGQLIVDVIPQIELIIDSQPTVVELPPAEAQNRFNYVFRQLMGVFASREHPLVIFLDDLQWADDASLRLMEYVLTYPDTKHLFLAGAFRDNEVGPTHPLVAVVDSIRNGPAKVEEIYLLEISFDALCEFLGDTLHSSKGRIETLAHLIYAKTGGNPFFVIQMLRTIYHQGLIWFNRDKLAWQWDTSKIDAVGFTDNVADLMVTRLEGLSETARDTLKLAAAVGNQLTIKTLAVVSETPIEDAEQAMEESVREGLMLRTGDLFKFAHDRIQQAAYSLVPDGKHAQMHLSIGRLLLADTPEEALDERIFDIVGHFNTASTLISTQEEKERVAELNLRAGLKAKSSAAYASAAAYLAAGSALLENGSWKRNYSTMYSLHLERAQCEFLSCNFDEAERLFPLLLEHATTRIDKANAHQIQVYLHTTKGENEKAIASAIECLKLFGIEVSPHPSWEQVLKDYERVWTNLDGKSIESLVDLPRMTDPEMLAVMNILSDMGPPAYFTDNNLRYLNSSLMVNLSLLHGNADASAQGYYSFGTVLGPIFGRYQEGYRFGIMAMSFVDKYDIAKYKGRAYYDFSNQVMIWNRPLKEALDNMNMAYDILESIGDITFACYCGNNIVTLRRVNGDPLSEVYECSKKYLDFAWKVRYDETTDIILGMQRLIRNLQGLTSSFSTFSDEEFDEEEFEEQLIKHRMPITVCWYHILKLQARFMSGDYDKALDAAAKAKELLWATRTAIHYAEFHYYLALASAAIYAKAPSDKKDDLLDTIKACHAEFKEWAENCPSNFGHGYLLLSAEISRISGRDIEAMRLYDEAIKAAQGSGFIQNEGLGNELAARFYMERNFETIARTYLREAAYCYERWGAQGKVKQLYQLYPQLLEHEPVSSATGAGIRESQIDVMTVAKASQAISGEIDLSKLLDTLMKIVVEQAGAQKGYLLLAHDSDYPIDVEAELDSEDVIVKLHEPPVSNSELPGSIINYVTRTKEMVLLDDATSTNPFSEDSYITHNDPRSVLCIPIVRQTELIGMLYLENNLLPGAFTQDRVTMLKLLSSQAAISLQNALEYDKRRVAEQRRFEAEEHKREFYRRTILAATGGKLVMAERGEIAELTCQPLAAWDVTSEEILSHIRKDVTKIALSSGMEEMRVYDFILTVGEAITNAVKHAAGGVSSLCDLGDSLIFTVSDTGPGIEALVLPEVAIMGGYSTKGTLGMGYKTIITIADKVYLATGNGGTTVAIEMKLKATEKPLMVDSVPDVFWE